MRRRDACPSRRQRQETGLIELDATSFHPTLAAQAMAACILHHGPFAECTAAVRALSGAVEGAWTWSAIDVGRAPEIAGMFGAVGAAPHLLVMREKVVLYCAPLPGTAEAVRSLLARAAALDMPRVRSELEQQRIGKAMLDVRRACPTTWRTR